MAKQHRRPAQDNPRGEETASGSVGRTAGDALQTMRETTGDGALGARIATVAAVGVAAALIEVDWIPGLLLGAAATMAPNLLPAIGRGLRPVVKGALRAGYSIAEKTRETVAQASEGLQDMVAEVRAEQHPGDTALAEQRVEAEPVPEHAG